jgi:8-oxo-dGTP pyrophosphatase MutT (NUDIX family)
MKRIFIDNHEVILFGKKDGDAALKYVLKNHLPYKRIDIESRRHLFSTIKTIERDQEEMHYLIGDRSEKKLEETFFSFYKIINAAGGVVRNKQGKVLMMFRRGKWDLPKGKLDKGESLKKAAIRETQEETGIGQLKIVKPIKFFEGKQDCTFHTYRIILRRVIKATYWYEMYSDDPSQLIPQEEEGITEVGWYSKKEIKDHLKNSYRSIQWVLKECGLGS